MNEGTCKWKTPSDTMPIISQDVHIWGVSLVQSEESVTAFRATLDSEELARADRFKFEQHRRRFIVSQGYLRQILGRYLNHPPHELQFGRTERGKPFLITPDANELMFNVSHSHELAIYAVMRNHEIGVDVEHLRPMPDAEQIAMRFFSASEQTTLLALPPEERTRAFFACWTRKEAFIKAIGEGLYYPLDQFSVSLSPDEPVCLQHVDTHPQEAASWTLRAFTPASDYVAAFAVRSPVMHVKYWWPDN
jgi:4'-phosphopantetheinyl transferase